jgi:hypothetical protein
MDIFVLVVDGPTNRTAAGRVHQDDVVDSLRILYHFLSE